MQSRGLVVIRLHGRTETATTNASLGNPEMGSSSTRTDNCNHFSLFSKMQLYKLKGIYIIEFHEGFRVFTSGDLRSTTEFVTTSLTAVATRLKHLLRSNKAKSSLRFEVLFEIFISVSSIPLRLYPTANYNVISEFFSPSICTIVTNKNKSQ